MGYRRLRIPGTAYRPMLVRDGERHEVRIRFVDCTSIGRDRGTAHAIVSRAAGYGATRRMTERRARKGRWHTVDVGRRFLARRMILELEMLAVHGIVRIQLDGHEVRLARERS